VAEAIKKGIESEGGHATILQVAETLPAEILARMSAPPKRDYPIATPADLLQYDAYMFGIAARYGGWPAQFKTFWDATGNSGLTVPLLANLQAHLSPQAVREEARSLPSILFSARLFITDSSMCLW
jgi:multimeric flavodoxin WrbA